MLQCTETLGYFSCFFPFLHTIITIYTQAVTKQYLFILIFLHLHHGLRTPGEEIVFTARPKIHSHFQIFRYSRSIFCLPHWPKFSDFFDLCLHWVSVVRDLHYQVVSFKFGMDSTIYTQRGNAKRAAKEDKNK